MTVTATHLTQVLSELEWRARAHEHEQRVRQWVQPWLERRPRGETHPVEDFLFTYYSHRPSQLSRWHPGLGVVCELAHDLATDSYLTGRGYELTPNGVCLDPSAFVDRLPTAQRIEQLLRNTAGRPAMFGCFGLHEWAMVYRLSPERVRHASWPLRLSPDDVAETVEAIGPRCTHYDAFRFFTEPAKPLNSRQLRRADQPSVEQPGCLHATMDLYKWSYKLSPLVPSELVADCFELARDVRLVDMQASPYDLAALDVDPIRIETPEGRCEYVTRQRTFTTRAQPLRERLLDYVHEIVRALTSSGDPE